MILIWFIVIILTEKSNKEPYGDKMFYFFTGKVKDSRTISVNLCAYVNLKASIRHLWNKLHFWHHKPLKWFDKSPPNTIYLTFSWLSRGCNFWCCINGDFFFQPFCIYMWYKWCGVSAWCMFQWKLIYIENINTKP